MIYINPASKAKDAVVEASSVAAREDLFMPHDFYDIISGDIMVDPVIADDNHTYSRATILEWFKVRQREGRPPTSPLTNEPLRDTALRANLTVKKALDEFVQEKERRAAQRASVQKVKYYNLYISDRRLNFI